VEHRKARGAQYDRGSLPTESAAIAEYRNAVAEALVVKAKVDSLDRHAKLLDLMVAAHRDLITPDLR